MTEPRCPLCNAAGSACGPSETARPIDTPHARKKGPAMAKLNNYEAVVNGMPTTLRLTEEDAERRGLLDVAAAVDGAEVNEPATHEVIDPAPAAEPTSAPEAAGKRTARAGKLA